MSIDIKPCYIYDMMREWFEVYGNQNFEEAKKEYVRAFKELYEYQQKDQRIAELEEQLKNAIVPKFKIGQEVYVIFDRTLWGERMVEIVSAKIIGIIATTKIQYMFSNLAAWYKEENVFATKEEAQAKLKELTAKNV